MLAIPDSPLCPLNAWQNMIRMVPANDDSLAFVFPNGKPVLYSNLQTNLKRMIKKTGIDPEIFSSHSFRRGGATWAFKAQVPAEFIVPRIALSPAHLSYCCYVPQAFAFECTSTCRRIR